MERLTNRTYMQAVLDRYGFTFKKKYGQNFLVSDAVVDAIADAADLSKEDYVVEIGPGIGTMTQVLSQRAGHVLAVELDPKLIPILSDTLAFCKNVEVRNEDILKTDLNQVVEEENGGRPVKIVANLPYYITTPILFSLLKKHVPVSSFTLMVQKEVAERMQAGPGSKDYGALSLAVSYYTIPEYICTVPADSFVPRPKVESAVVRLDQRQEPAVSGVDENQLFLVIRAAFQQRRKMLSNVLSKMNGVSITREEVQEILRNLSLREDIRGEKLTLSEFAAVTSALAEKGAFS